MPAQLTARLIQFALRKRLRHRLACTHQSPPRQQLRQDRAFHQPTETPPLQMTCYPHAPKPKQAGTATDNRRAVEKGGQSAPVRRPLPHDGDQATHPGHRVDSGRGITQPGVDQQCQQRGQRPPPPTAFRTGEISLVPFTKLVEKQKATPFYSGSPGKKKSAKRRKAYKLSLPLIPLVHEGDTRTDLLASCGSVRLSI